MTHAAVRPLSGVRILAVEHYGAGPFASLYLSDLGAEVIKIEDPGRGGQPGGDSSRQSGPHFLGPQDSHFFQTFNLGKKSVALDIRAPEGRAIFDRLVAGSDAVLNNLRGDQPAKLGLTYAALASLNPRIVCAHLSGYGSTGPRAAWPAYDYLMQAEAGFLHLTGEPGSTPSRMGLSIVDYLSGITLAFATVSALFGALRSGTGRDVEVTLYDVAMHQLTYPATWYLNTGDVVERRPRSGHPSVVPCEVFPTRDGQIFIMCVLPKFWEALCAVLGESRLVTDQRFAQPPDRFQNRDALVGILDAVLCARSTAEWMSALAGRVPAAPILALPQALDNPYLAQTGGIQTLTHPAAAEFRVMTNPIRIDGNRIAAQVAPALGADTAQVLSGVGLTQTDLADLAARGIIAGPIGPRR